MPPATILTYSSRLVHIHIMTYYLLIFLVLLLVDVDGSLAAVLVLNALRQSVHDDADALAVLGLRAVRRQQAARRREVAHLKRPHDFESGVFDNF